MTTRGALVAIAAVSITAPLAGQVVSDSAGVRVTTTRQQDAPAAVWKLAATPVFDLGAASGSVEYELDGIRGGLILPDGSIVVVNGGTNQLRFYDAAGRHVRSIGKKGEGPGEFSYLELAGRVAGDSLLAWDRDRLRFTVFDAEGRTGRTARAEGERIASTVQAGVVSNGHMVAMRRDLMGAAADPSNVASVRPNATVVTIRSDGALGTTLGSFPDAELSRYNRAVAPLVFGRGLRVAARGDLIAVANTDAYSIRIYSSAGRLQRIVRQQRQPQPISDADYLRAKPPIPPTSRSPLGPAYEQMKKPSTYPAFEALLLDSVGNLWVQDFARTWDTSLVWQVFDIAGRLIGRITVPSTHKLLDATPTRAMFRVTDALDVQHVRVYSIQK
jgi:hypothetical protein